MYTQAERGIETLSAAIYARVSTTDQDPTMQIRELKEFCDQRFWKVFDRYVDEGISGSAASRPALDRLMRDARARKFHAVVVWKFDRFARSLIHLVEALETFHALGIDFVSLHDSIDTTTPQGKLFFQITAAFAEYEHAIIRQRVKAGMENAKALGKKLGRPTVPVDAARVAALRAHGASWREISRDLGISMEQHGEPSSALPKSHHNQRL